MTLTRHLQRTWDGNGEASLRVARGAFIEYAQEFDRPVLLDVATREAEIAALPAVEWKGRTLRTIRCQGDFGKGPHDMNVPEAILWSLINLNRFICPYHR